MRVQDVTTQASHVVAKSYNRTARVVGVGAMPQLTRSLIAADDVSDATNKVKNLRVTAKTSSDVPASTPKPSSHVPAGSRVAADFVESAQPAGKKEEVAQGAPEASVDTDASKASAKQPEARLGSPPQVAAETDAWWKVRRDSFVTLA